MQQEQQYQGDTCGIFFALTSSPVLGKDASKYRCQIGEIFDKYRNNTWNKFDIDPIESVDNKPTGNFLYEEEAYCLFGSFDMGFLSLVDSFDFAARNFHSFSENIESSEPIPFNWQTLNGSGFYFGEKKDLKESYLEEKWKNIVKKSHNRYPLISVTSLKFSFSLLMGTGSNLTRLAANKIIDILNKYKGNNLDYILLETTSWHEFALILFSDSYTTCAKCITEIRELELDGIMSSLSEDKKQQFYRDSLAEIFLSKENKNNVQFLHIFDNTNTTFGYHFDIYKHYIIKKDTQEPLDFLKVQEEELHFSINFDLKPGHLSSFKSNNRGNSNILIGKGDLSVVLTGGLLDYLKELEKIAQSKNSTQDLRKIITRINIPLLDETILHEVNTDHPRFHEEIGKYYSFKQGELKSMIESLRKIGLSKTMRDRVMHLFEHFNTTVNDPLQIGSFIELRPFLSHLKDEITIYASSNVGLSKNDISTIIEDAIIYYDRARSNRLFHGYMLSDMSEMNIDFHGSVGQILTAFDGAYKQMCSVLGEDKIRNYRSFAYIGGHEGVDSNIYSLRMNFFHLYQPESFCNIALHEAANWYLDRLQEEVEFNELERFVVMDSITFYLAFAGDLDLFCFWHYGFFFQHNRHYDLKQCEYSVLADKFYDFSTRMLLAAFKVEHAWHKLEDNVRSQYTPSLIIDVEEWNKFCNSALVFKEKLEKKPNEKELHQDFDDAQKNIQNALFVGLAPLADEMKIKMLTTADGALFDALGLRKERFNRYYNIFKCNPWAHFTDSEWTSSHPAFKINVINYCYLRYIKERFFTNGLEGFKSIPVLPRKDGTPDSEKIKNSTTKVYFDPQGGLFVACAKSRKELFYHRTMLTKTLWDLAMKNKKDIFIQEKVS